MKSGYISEENQKGAQAMSMHDWNHDGKKDMVDNFIEFLVMNGRSIEEAIMLLVPEPWTKNKDMDLSLRSYFEFNSTFMEPWDGPAAILFTDGDKLGATLDRNGLRPLRYCQTKDNRIIFYSETTDKM